MKIINKLLIASTMVVTLGATASCGNKEKSEEFVAGTSYTYIAFNALESKREYKVEFGCEGNPTTYWDFLENPEVSDHNKSHTYYNEKSGEYTPVIIIEGNISSLWFCDEKGVPLADGNAKIDIIVFSNTITSIRKYACYGLKLEGAYIPASIKTMGKNAFLPYDPQAFFCEPPSRPSGWDVYWCTLGEYNRIVTWGFSYHIDEETGEVYLLVSDDDVKTAIYQGYIFNNPETLVIPKKIKVNNRDFIVAIINDVGIAKNITSITIPESVTLIGGSAFKDCDKLSEVKFEGNFTYLILDSDIFWSCTSLQTITLPEGLVNLASYTFDNCTSLQYVKIPSSVKEVGYNVFYNSSAEKELTIDLTAFKDVDKIAYCDSGCIYNCDASKITFQINSNLDKQNFIDKGWPEEGGKVVWEQVAPTSLS